MKPIILFSLLVGSACAEDIPKTWDDRALVDWATPVAGLNVRPAHFSEREYYAAPVENLRTYPVYAPDREPAGYWESLQKKKPEPLIDLGKTRTDADWVRDGKRVFEEMDVPAFRVYDEKVIARARSSEEVKKSRATVLRDGMLIGYRWAVTPKGVALSINDCAGCHTRVMPDGSLLHGAPFNYRAGSLILPLLDRGNELFFPGDSPEMVNYRQFGMPWIKPDIHEQLKTLKPQEFGGLFGSNIPGTFARFNGSPYYPTKVPDLIGIGSRKYIDHTGTHRLRGIGDVMRYAALVSVGEPADFGPHRMLADNQRRILYRFPDELFYAMAKYIYALEPPANPNKFDDQAASGQKIFAKEGCGGCHAAPLYTNNKLTVATGFKPPKEHLQMFDVMNMSVGTDPGAALKTRKGTGYYKIPSLKNLWYRGLYLHDGSVASLEEMFDPARLGDQHVPGGFKGYKVKNRAIPGHEFGLKLKPEERASLIVFLRTL
jgi:mono/diheme cytochrome c family protein